jgi:hypothetical protein
MNDSTSTDPRALELADGLQGEADWYARFHELAELLLGHLAQEEERTFPLARARLCAAEAHALGRRLAELRRARQVR